MWSVLPVRLRPGLVALGICLFLALESDCFHQQICGKSLPQTLALVCKGCYNNKEKKFVHSSLEDDSLWEDSAELRLLELPAIAELQPAPPFRERLRAADLLGDTFRRFARGVADECCHKPCTRAELLNYCCPQKGND